MRHPCTRRRRRKHGPWCWCASRGQRRARAGKRRALPRNPVEISARCPGRGRLGGRLAGPPGPAARRVARGAGAGERRGRSRLASVPGRATERRERCARAGDPRQRDGQQLLQRRARNSDVDRAIAHGRRGRHARHARVLQASAAAGRRPIRRRALLDRQARDARLGQRCPGPAPEPLGSLLFQGRDVDRCAVRERRALFTPHAHAHHRRRSPHSRSRRPPHGSPRRRAARARLQADEGDGRARLLRPEGARSSRP